MTDNVATSDFDYPQDFAQETRFEPSQTEGTCAHQEESSLLGWNYDHD